MTALGAPKATGERRKKASIRQQRWRQRQRVRTQVRQDFQEIVGRPPTDEEMLELVEQELRRIGLAAETDPSADRADDDDEPTLRAEDFTSALDVLMPNGADDNQDDDADQMDAEAVPGDVADASAVAGGVDPAAVCVAASPITHDQDHARPAHGGGKVVDFKTAAAALLPPDHPARNSLGRLERALALSSVAFELRVAASRERVFQLLMRHAEQGDVSAAIWLASRLAPPAKQRRTVVLPEFEQLNLRTLDGVQAGIDLVIKRAASGDLDLADVATLMEALNKRQLALEASCKAAAYEAAAEQLRERTSGGLAARLEAVRARIAGRADDGRLIEATPERDQ